MIQRTPLFVAPLVLLLGCGSESATPTQPLADLPVQMSKTAQGGRAGAMGAVYVSSQGLYYDTFVAAETLPMKGRFQKLEAGVTEFGPGDPGYLGGRWWEDLNGNGVQDEDDHFFLCPLLPPGRPNP